MLTGNQLKLNLRESLETTMGDMWKDDTHPPAVISGAEFMAKKLSETIPNKYNADFDTYATALENDHTENKELNQVGGQLQQDWTDTVDDLKAIGTVSAGAADMDELRKGVGEKFLELLGQDVAKNNVTCEVDIDANGKITRMQRKHIVDGWGTESLQFIRNAGITTDNAQKAKEALEWVSTENERFVDGVAVNWITNANSLQEAREAWSAMKDEAHYLASKGKVVTEQWDADDILNIKAAGIRKDNAVDAYNVYVAAENVAYSADAPQMSVE